MAYSVDTNILLHASNSASPHRPRASSFLEECARNPETFCLAWVTVFGYMRITTHPGIFPSPLLPAEALSNVTALLDLPQVRVIGEGIDGHAFLREYIEASGEVPARGNHVPDVHLAAILRHHGVRLLYTADTDFRRFAYLDVRNPLLP